MNEQAMERLEDSIDSLVEKIAAARRENAELRKKQSLLYAEHVALNNKNHQAANHIKSIIGKLKAIEVQA